MAPRRPVLVLAFAAGCALLSVPASPARAHTEADVVAVPAGEPATVTLRPTHGCGESPTVSVATRVPVEGAAAGEVPGWTSSAEPDDEGNTVVEWTGGSLPADEEGAFPVSFVASASVGELLTFPFVQTCANGEELAWISGDPAAEFPAPRVLILPAGSEPAATIDDVPPDAPGREQLVAIVDIDDPSPDDTTTTTATTSTTARSATNTPATTGANDADADADDGDDGGPVLPVLVVVACAAIAGGFVLARRRRA